MLQPAISGERIRIVHHDHLAAQGHGPGHTVRIERHHTRLPGRCDTVVLRQREIQIAVLLLALPDQVEQTVLIARRRQRNANFVHHFEGCGAVESVLRELRALAAPGVSSPQRLPEGLWISKSDVCEWNPGPCRWYLRTRPDSC